MSQTNLIAVFAPPPPAETYSAAKPPDTGDTGFQKFLDDAVHKASPAPENHKSGADSKDHSRPPAESGNPPGNPATSLEARESDPAVAQESVPTHSTPGSSNEASVKELPVDNYQKAVERLKDLGFDTETIDKLLEFLNDTSQANAAAQLQALTAHLSQLNDSLLKDFLAQNLSSGQNLLNPQQSRQDLAVNLLQQAGLTDQEARDLLQQIQSLLTQKSDPKNALTGKNRTPAAEDTVPRPEIVNPVARETSKDTGSPQKDGESSESKAHFFSQLDAKRQALQTAQERSPMERLLNQEANRPQTHPSPKTGEKTEFKHATLEKIALSDPLQGIGQPAGNIPEGSTPRGSDGLKINADFQIQNLNVAGENGQKAASITKASLPDNPIYKAPVETRVIDQIVNRISLRSNGSQNEIKIKLDPPSLGTVRMNIIASGETVRTVVVAENHAVKQMIENNISQLRDSMNGQGLKMDGFTVLVGGDSHPEFSGHNNPSGRSGHGFSDSMNPRGAPAVDTPAEPVTRASLGFYDLAQTVSVFA